MPENLLTSANRLLDESASLNAGDAIRFLFGHYRCGRLEMQDAIVLALIGEVLTSRAMRATGLSYIHSTATGASP